MSNSKSEEIQSRTLEAFFNGAENTENKTEVVNLPEIRESEENQDYDLDGGDVEEIQEKKDEEPEFLEEKDTCIPGLGKIFKGGKKSNSTPQVSQSIFDGGRAKYFLYGLMGLGLASQVLK